MDVFDDNVHMEVLVHAATVALLPLASVDNKTAKDPVAKLGESELAPKTIVEIAIVLNEVVASAINGDGKQMFSRQWNNEYIDLPKVALKALRVPFGCSTAWESLFVERDHVLAEEQPKDDQAIG
jgi:hypothetical protein